MKRASKRPKPKRRKRAAVRRRGLMFVLSSPSGAGKTTLTRLLLDRVPRMRLSISATTRPRRRSEVESVHYYFVDPKRFTAMRRAGELMEWAKVHGNYYGTPKAPVERALKAGTDMLFDIDWQGALQLYRKARPDVVSIFILPPSIDELRRRLARRAEDDAKTIRKRLANALEEIGHWKEYDYVLVNKDLNRSYSDLRAIVAAERARRERKSPAVRTRNEIQAAQRLKRTRQPRLRAFVRSLQEDL
jgi:guanylate kinase